MAVALCWSIKHFISFTIRGCTVAQWLVCWTANREVQGSNPGQGRNLVWDFCSTCANSAMLSTLTTHCQLEDETVTERTGHPPSYTVAKKMKSLTLHTHGCPRASLRDWSSSSSSKFNSLVWYPSLCLKLCLLFIGTLAVKIEKRLT